MPIIGNVERKYWKTKVLNAAIHFVLLLGAVTMIYPLLIMLSGSFKSSVDFNDFSILPEFLYKDELLFQKYLDSKYNGQTVILFESLREPLGIVTGIRKPENPVRIQAEDYRAFLAGLRKETPHYWRGMGMTSEFGVYPLVLREFWTWLQKKYGEGPKGLAAFNKEIGTNFTSWDAVTLPCENFLPPERRTDYSSGILRVILEFKTTQVKTMHMYWFDLDGKFASYVKRYVSSDLAEVNKLLDTSYRQWSDISLPQDFPEKQPALGKLWNRFVREEVNGGFLELRPSASKAWTEYLQAKYSDIHALNKLYNIRAETFDEIPLPPEKPADGQRKTDWNEFLFQKAPADSIHVKTLAGEYRAWLQRKYGSLPRVNEVYRRGYADFGEVELKAEKPQDNLPEMSDWSAFVNTLAPQETGLVATAMVPYRLFVEKEYTGRNQDVDFEKMSHDLKTRIVSSGEIPFSQRYPSSKTASLREKGLYTQFIREPANDALRRIVDTAALKPAWTEFLRKKYGTVANLNAAWGKIYTSWEFLPPPTREYEWFNTIDHKWFLCREFLKRNYLMVFDTIITNGNAAKNTFIYCTLAVLATLLVNPLCAYALSRYRMAAAYKILLFLMLPMAFPAMVLGIPQFILIRDLGLLNTFGALILPGMANGYSIFLLKGFFDSLPKELFESAAIDGASEWTVFWHIAMGLSTPILAVIALGAFTSAYANFMMAFLLCQDQSMWTMMEHLYQLQMRTSQAVGFAALIIAAIPTLLVFIFCQNIILKGIVVPSEK